MRPLSLLVALSSITVVALASQEEHRLYQTLLKDYDKLERPVENSSTPVTVKLGVILQQLIHVDEKNQIIEINAWLKYTWTDYKLRWEPREYGGVGNARFPVDIVWMPDVLLYNSVDKSFDSTYPTNTLVYSDGTVTWIPPGIFKISCKINIAWFPFDEQNCYFKFGSWTYDGLKLDLQPDPDGFDISEYLANGEWSLRGTTVLRSIKYYECCPEPYPDLKFYLTMRRRTLYYEITIMLSICFFLSIVAEMSPPTSEAVPLLGAFFSCCMFLVSGSVMFTVLVLNLHYRNPETHEMGHFTRAILLHWLPWLLMMSRPGHHLSRRSLPHPLGRRAKTAGSGDAEALLRNGRDADDADSRLRQCAKQIASTAPQMSAAQQVFFVMQQRIIAELKFITRRMSAEDEEKFAESEWKFAAMVVDRLCLIFFAVLIIASTCGILFSAPYTVA